MTVTYRVGLRLEKTLGLAARASVRPEEKWVTDLQIEVKGETPLEAIDRMMRLLEVERDHLRRKGDQERLERALRTKADPDSAFDDDEDED
jgi:hypothetical protein